MFAMMQAQFQAAQNKGPAAETGAAGQGTGGGNVAPMPAMPIFEMPIQSKSMDRQEKRKLMNEIKEEMKILITQISDYQVEQAVTIVKT